jgi:hypothetical protein
MLFLTSIIAGFMVMTMVLGGTFWNLAVSYPAVTPPTIANTVNQGELEFEVKLFIEFNSTDEDIGLQLNLGGDAWRNLRIRNPQGRTILYLHNFRSLRKQGLSSLMFESAEPPLDEVPIEEFFQRFPEGAYQFQGRTIENDPITGEASLSHVVPAGPEIVSPLQDPFPPVLDIDNVQIAWEPVETDIFGSNQIEIVQYQVTVAELDSSREFSIFLPNDATSVSVPQEFFRLPGKLHEFEVLAIEANGNQTIAKGFFMTTD